MKPDVFESSASYEFANVRIALKVRESMLKKSTKHQFWCSKNFKIWFRNQGFISSKTVHFHRPNATLRKIFTESPEKQQRQMELSSTPNKVQTHFRHEKQRLDLQYVQKVCSDYLNLVIFGDFQNNFRPKIEIFKIALPARSGSFYLAILKSSIFRPKIILKISKDEQIEVVGPTFLNILWSLGSFLLWFQGW